MSERQGPPYTAATHMEPAHFGEMMGRLRRIAGISQREFKPTLGLSASAVSKIEHGNQRFPRKKLPQLVDLLAPHYLNRENLERDLQDQLNKDDQKGDLSSSISARLQKSLTAEELSMLNDRLSLPQVIEGLRRFLGTTQ